ncbi:serine/threonine-protein kinase [Pseudonocardia humida]|uniref:non-specific serine/threonine protein kinase n=1 Tax=Pseudonocardia humida TaxID=2800819 RepID=A0ABT0ZVI9_9PSEU|nr:serine/threonine-protein kinase [Pseudonocardia humida]MCO1654751.1 serine/threonine protein kinase [Pseudonocardia humida]
MPSRGGSAASGTVLGPYRLVSLVGQGGMAEVWRAVDTRKDREVALKLLGPWLRGDTGFERRFRRESALVARLHSPNVIPIHDFGEVGGRLFIDMPLVEGTDLGTLIGRDGPLAPERAVRIVEQVAHGLAAAHRAGLVHRDVKPSNVLLTGDGSEHAYLIDFGVARSVDGTLLSSSIGAVIGTPAYLAPERFDGDGDHRGDVYALGCLLHEALTGEPPFSAPSLVGLVHAHQHTPPPRPSARPGVPAAMDGVVARVLAKDPGRRFPTATDLASAARAALTAAPAPVVPQHRSMPTAPLTAPTPTGPDRPSRLRPVAVALSATVVVAAAAVLAVVISDGASTATGTPHAPAAASSPAAPPAPGAHPAERVLSGHSAAVFGVVATRVDGRAALVSGSSDATLRVWDAETGAQVAEPITEQRAGVTAMAGGEVAGRPVVLTAGEDGAVRTWDPSTGLQVGKPVRSGGGEVLDVALDDVDGRRVIVFGGTDGIVRLADAATGDPVGTPLAGHTSRVNALATARLGDRTVVVSVSQDRTVRVGDPTAGTPIGEPMTGHTGPVLALAVAEVDGRPVAVSGGEDATVRRWDLATGTPIGDPLTGHTGPVRGLAVITVDGRPAIVSTGDDRALRLWDPATGAPIGDPITGHTGSVVVAMATELADGPVLVSGSTDATVRTWDLRTRMAG